MGPNTETVESGVLDALAKHWGVVFTENADDEYVSACPRCGDGGKGAASDRFHVWLSYPPRWWCRKCGWRGQVASLELFGGKGLSGEELRKAKAEQQAKREAAYLEAHEAMRECSDYLTYYHALLSNSNLIKLWTRAGMNMDTIHRFKLGYCDACPTDKEHRPSMTIPVFAGGVLFDIQHRLIGAPSGDKYRPHRKHLGVWLFNADSVQEHRQGLLVEGAKKTMVALQHGLVGCVGTYGSDALQGKLIKLLEPWDQVFVLYDPDAANQAEEAASAIGPKARVVDLPGKLDDLLCSGLLSREDVLRAMRFARRMP